MARRSHGRQHRVGAPDPEYLKRLPADERWEWLRRWAKATLESWGPEEDEVLIESLAMSQMGRRTNADYMDGNDSGDRMDEGQVTQLAARFAAGAIRRMEQHVSDLSSLAENEDDQRRIREAVKSLSDRLLKHGEGLVPMEETGTDLQEQ